MATGGIGSLTVFLGLDAAEFSNGLQKSQAQAASTLGAVKEQVNGVSASLKALAGFTVAGIGVAYFAGIIEGAVEARSNLLRLSTTTGETVENLSALSKIGKFTGTGIDEISRATVLLNKNLASGEEGSKNAQKALVALGLSYDDLKGKSPADQLQTLAKALAGFEDGTGKATAATFLLGKAGADLLPFLKDLAGQQVLVSKVTAESAREADEYRRNLIALSTAGEEFKRDFANAVIPVLAEVTARLLDGRKAFGGYGAALLGLLGNAGSDDTGENLKNVRVQIDAVTASLERAKTSGEGFKDPLGGFSSQDDTESKALENRLTQLKKVQAYFVSIQQREALAGTAGQVLDKFDRKPRLDVPGSVGDKTAKATKELNDFDKIFKQVNGTLGEAQIQFDALEQGLGKVDAAHLAGAKIAAQLAAGELHLTEEQVAQIDATLKQQSAVEQATEALKRNLDAIRESTDANAARIESMQKTRDSYETEARNAEDAVRTFGLSREALDALAGARDRDAAAALRQKAALAEDGSFGNDALAEAARLYREQAAAIDQTAAARERLTALSKQTQEAVQINDAVKSSFEGAFADFASGAKTASQAFKSFADGIISGLARIAAQKTAEQIFGTAGGAFGGAGGGTGLFAGLLNSSKGPDVSAPGAASDAGNGNGATVSTLASLAKLFSGFFADGGYIPPGRFGVVGERGPELAFGGQSGRTIQPVAAGGARTNYISVNVPAGAKQDYGMQVGAGIARQLAIADRRNN